MSEEKSLVQQANEAFEKQMAEGKPVPIAKVEKDFGLKKGQLKNYRSNRRKIQISQVEPGSVAAPKATLSLIPENQIIRVPVVRVRMEGNSRKVFVEEKLEELKDSMRRTKGPMQPVIGYLEGKLGEGPADVLLVMGERRLRAQTELASEDEAFSEIEVKVIPRPTRKEFLEWNLMENLQREDLLPSEVAERFAAMLEERDEETGRPLYTQAGLAEAASKPKSFVSDCLSLRRALPSVQEAVDQGICCLETGAHIGSLPSSMQPQAEAEMIRGIRGAMNQLQARQWVAEQYRRDLRKADFETETRGLSTDEGEALLACVDCEWWGGNREDVGGKLASTVCLNPKCFEAKQRAMVARSLEEEPERVRLLSGAERERVLDPARGGIAADCGYVELSAKPDAYFLAGGEAARSTSPTWSKALEGCEPETVVVFDESGRKRTLVETAVAVEGAMQGPHGAKFSEKVASRYETRAEKQRRLRLEGARRKAAMETRQACLVEFARLFSLDGWSEALPAIAQLTLEQLCDQADVKFLSEVMEVAVGREVSLSPDGIRDLLTADLETLIVLALQVRRVRLDGWDTWLEEDSPMHAICESAQWDAKSALARVRSAVTKAEKEERKRLEEEDEAERERRAKEREEAA